jgi:hypothetical protein
MRIAQVTFFNYRGLKTGQVTLPNHGVLLGANNVGKTAVVEAIALVFGRERVNPQLSDWDFFGGWPQPSSRFTIVCTVTGFPTNNPNEYPNWFGGGESSAQPIWWHEGGGKTTCELDCPIGAGLAAQVALCGRYDEEDCEFETKRYFYHGPGDPFTDGCETVSLRRLEEDLGIFIVPGNRQWDRLLAFGSSTFIKALRQSEAIPGAEITKLKQELRDSKSGIEDSSELKKLLTSAENELKSLTMMASESNLVYRATLLDTLNVLQNLVPHVRDAQGGLFPFSKNGAGMVSLQSFLIVLAIAQRRKSLGKNFVLIAEEPELHLHPALHKRLANRIRSVSTQSVITTHSPQVAAVYKPSDSILLRNQDGNLTAERLRTESIKDISSNAIRKLYLQRREAFYEAILGAAVLVPEGEHDYEWLRHLQRIMESSEKGSPSSLPLSVVPTQDGQIVDTYSEVARFNASALPLVDGDNEGQKHCEKLCNLNPPPKQIVQFGNDAATEFLAAWVLEPCLSNPGPILTGLLSSVDRNVKALQQILKTNKKDRELHENLMSEALDNPVSVERATEFLEDLSAIITGKQPKNSGWKQSSRSGGPQTYTATHIHKA